MPWQAQVDVDKLKSALVAFDNAAVVALCDDLVHRIFRSADPYPPLEATKLLSLLRQRRFFAQMQRLADTLLQTGIQSNSLRRLYAQALLDGGHFTTALQVLEQLIADTEGNDPKENAEARGLKGRAYKQMYVSARAPKVARNQAWLGEAASAYFEPYRIAPEKNAWHGINVVAVLDRSARDRVPIKVPGIPQAAALAQEILDGIRQKDAVNDATLWDYGTAVEACLALGESCEALNWARQYVKDPKGNAFEFGSTLRQLEEVWQLPRTLPDAVQTQCEEAILALLRASVLERQGGSVVADGRTVRAELSELRATNLEKVFGADRFASLDWYRRGLARCAAVARIGREVSKGLGTGFILRGGSLHASLGDSLYMLTNAHVISESPEVPIAITPDEAVVTFEGLAGAEGQTWRVGRVVFSSPIREYDATLVELDRPLVGVEPYPIAKRLPPLGGDLQRVYVVGHPLGGGLSFSLQDNLLLDWDERRVHYRAPTEPGSSGSPVFNDQWELIALHHAGRADMRKLHDQPDTYEANEGISILAIQDGIARALARV